MRYFKTVLYSLLLILVLVISIMLFLLTTTPGLYTTIKLANLILPGTIKLQHVQGRLIDTFKVGKLTYQSPDLNMHIQQLNVKWHLSALLNGQLNIHHLQADDLHIQLKSKSEPSEPFTLPNLPIRLQIQELQLGQLTVTEHSFTQQFHHVHLQATLDDELWNIHRLNAHYAESHISLSAKLQPHAPYALLATLQMQAHIQQETLQADIKLSGDNALYHWQGTFHGFLEGGLRGTLKNTDEINSQIQWENARWPLNKKQMLHSQKGELSLNGTLKDLILKGELQFNAPMAANWQFNAQIQPEHIEVDSLLKSMNGTLQSSFFYDKKTHPAFRGAINAKSLDLTELGLPLSKADFHLQFTGENLQNFTVDTELTAQYQQQILHGRVNYKDQQWQTELTLGANHIEAYGQSLSDWKATAILPQPHLLYPKLKGLQTTITADAKVNSVQQGRLNLQITPGSFKNPDNKSMLPLHFQGGHLEAKLTPNALQAQGSFTIDREKILNLSLVLPHFRLDKTQPLQQEFEGKLNLHVDSLEFLQKISKHIERPHGEVNLTLKGQGTFANPIIEGNINLTNGSLFLPDLNLNVNPIQAGLITHDKQWTLKGVLGSNGQALSISGEGLFSPEVSGEVTLQGNQVPIADTAEYKAKVSPQLKIAFKPNAIDIRGEILVPEAKLKPISFSNTEDLTSDAVFVNDKKTDKLPLDLTMRVELKMGDNVALEVKGLKGFLAGEIEIIQQSQSEPYAIGELNIRDGKYQAYGQDLTIEQGQLIFTGGVLTNPTIRLRAVRYFNNAESSFSGTNQLFDFNPENLQSINLGDKVTVGIEMSGPLDSAKVKLFSIPPTLSQADILSMLLLGKPANQASKSGGQLLLTAISSMNLDSGTKGFQLMEQLKQSLGFDINIQNTPTYNQQANQVSDNTALVVGKALTKRLYLSYNIGLFEPDSNVFTIKYILNKFFSIQVTTSDIGSGLDLLYTRSKD